MIVYMYNYLFYFFTNITKKMARTQYTKVNKTKNHIITQQTASQNHLLYNYLSENLTHNDFVSLYKKLGTSRRLTGRLIVGKSKWKEEQIKSICLILKMSAAEAMKKFPFIKPVYVPELDNILKWDEENQNNIE